MEGFKEPKAEATGRKGKSHKLKSNKGLYNDERCGEGAAAPGGAAKVEVGKGGSQVPNKKKTITTIGVRLFTAFACRNQCVGLLHGPRAYAGPPKAATIFRMVTT